MQWLPELFVSVASKGLADIWPASEPGFSLFAMGELSQFFVSVADKGVIGTGTSDRSRGWVFLYMVRRKSLGYRRLKQKRQLEAGGTK
jgi:hypothetical protein